MLPCGKLHFWQLQNSVLQLKNRLMHVCEIITSTIQMYHPIHTPEEIHFLSSFSWIRINILVLISGAVDNNPSLYNCFLSPEIPNYSTTSLHEKITSNPSTNRMFPLKKYTWPTTCRPKHLLSSKTSQMRTCVHSYMIISCWRNSQVGEALFGVMDVKHKESLGTNISVDVCSKAIETDCAGGWRYYSLQQRVCVVSRNNGEEHKNYYLSTDVRRTVYRNVKTKKRNMVHQFTQTHPTRIITFSSSLWHYSLNN